MAREWSADVSGKFFCPNCGALYEVLAATEPVQTGSSPACVVCRTDMELRTRVPAGRPYRLVQRPETGSDF